MVAVKEVMKLVGGREEGLMKWCPLLDRKVIVSVLLLQLRKLKKLGLLFSWMKLLCMSSGRGQASTYLFGAVWKNRGLKKTDLFNTMLKL